MSRRRLPSIAAAAALTLGAGLGATAILFAAVSRLEYDKLSLSFQQRAGQRAAAIQKGLDDAVQVLTVTNQLFDTVTPLTRAQFHAFTAPLLERHPFIQAFNFHRIVPHAQRAAFEAGLRREFPDYTMREMREGRLVPVRAKDNYNIVDYLEPLGGNEAALGIDVSPNRLMRDAIELAIASGRPSATGLLKLAQAPGAQRGFVLLMPVYRPGAPRATPQQRRAAWIGDTAAVIRAGDLVQKILRGAALADDAGLELAVYAGAGAGPDELIYGKTPPPQAAPGLWPRWLSLDQHASYRQTLLGGGRPWQVHVTAAARPFLADHLGSLSALLGGILFSVLTAAFVQSLAQRSRRIQRLVDERTAALRLSNEKLNEDVRARRHTERALQASEQRFRRLLALSSDWYWEQDAQFRFTHITSDFTEKTQIPVERLIGLTRWHNHVEMRASAWGMAHIAALRRHQPFFNFEYALADRNGALRWLSINGEPLFDEQGQFKGYRGTGADITERKLAEQRIHHIAHHDVLTGLPNRMLLQERLAQAIDQARASGQPCWVLLIDLDRFKFVNDSLGHKAGDLLLSTVATRLRAALDEDDTVARLSGDEFVAVLVGRAQRPLERALVQRLMHSVAQPLMLEGKEFFVTCSIGIAIHADDGGAPHKLLEQADVAMYCAKKQGRNNLQFYTTAMNEEALERLRIESALRHALERQQFILHYQPQLDLQSGRIVGMEALIRWQHPELGMVAPDRFIGLAEETGLIVPIGAWVLRTACAQARAWQEAGLGPLRIAVNLSARQFGEPDLVGAIAAALRDSGLAPSSLELELTESLFMHDAGLAIGQLHDLKALGVQLSIDDFGTGYSSFAYLRRLPIDVLKIDRSFVNHIASDADDGAIVASIIALAHNLRLRVIAEGVETASQLAFLRRHGCDEMQGYYYSRPLAAPQCAALLRERPALAA